MSALRQQAIAAYSTQEWNNYAHLFASVTTSMQLAVYQDASQYLHGNIVDCGSGTAKIAPILAQKSNASSYTGIDLSEEMVAEARWLLKRLNQKTFKIIHDKIEHVSGRQFTSGVSIQSYYTWPDPNTTLKHIFDMLAEQATFVLVTPNLNLNLTLLAKHAELELLTHPYFDAYKDYNLKLAGNSEANFISMDALLKQVQTIGFQVEECHQRHFLGGLNFLVLRKL